MYAVCVGSMCCTMSRYDLNVPPLYFYSIHTNPRLLIVVRKCCGLLPVNMKLSHLTKWSFVSLFQMINCCLLTQKEGALLRIIRPQNQQTPHKNMMRQRSKWRGAEGILSHKYKSGTLKRDAEMDPQQDAAQLFLQDCFNIFWVEILQFDWKEDSAARLRDLLIVLVALDLLFCKWGKQCHGTVLQVDYNLHRYGHWHISQSGSQSELNWLIASLHIQHKVGVNKLQHFLGLS